MTDEYGLNTASIDRWRTPASEYPRRSLGRARVKTAWYRPGHYECYGVNGFDYWRPTRRAYVTALEIDGKTWMVDDPPHWWAMQDHARHLRGRVLCAGLGLGLMVHALDAEEDVCEIVVVERDLDVVKLVVPQLPLGKLRVVHGDFLETSPGKLGRVDSILFDLFVGHGPSFLASSFEVAANLIRVWGDHVTVRIHGMRNPEVETVGRRVLAAWRAHNLA